MKVELLMPRKGCRGVLSGESNSCLWWWELEGVGLLTSWWIGKHRSQAGIRLDMTITPAPTVPCLEDPITSENIATPWGPSVQTHVPVCASHSSTAIAHL